MSESKIIDELREFLLPDAPTATKGPAVCYLLGLTATDNGLAVFRQNDSLIDALSNLIQRDSNSTIISKAYETVLNLSSHNDLALNILSRCNDFVQNNLVADALDTTRPNVTRLCCGTIANLTQTTECAEKMWPLLEASADNLLSAFCRRNDPSSSQVEARSATAAVEMGHDSSQDHLAFVFANLTTLGSVRTWFTDPTQQRLEKLLPFISISTTATRKYGVVSTIRNCAFDTVHHEWLLEKLHILPRLLCPLIGPEVDENLDEEEMEQLPIDCQYLGADKEIEQSADIRKMLIETLTQLCATRLGRKHLKNNGAYYVLRELHKVEKERPVFLACENLVDILIQDEPEQDNLKELDIPSDLVEKFNKMDAEALQGID